MMPAGISPLLAGAEPLSDKDVQVLSVHVRAARLRAGDERRRRQRIERFAADLRARNRRGRRA